MSLNMPTFIILGVICTDYFASYDSSTGQCECNSGLSDTPFGCQGFTDIEAAPSDTMVDEIMRRLTAIQAASTYSKFSANRLTRHTFFWQNMKDNVSRKTGLVSGKRSRIANNAFYSGIFIFYP